MAKPRTKRRLAAVLRVVRGSLGVEIQARTVTAA